MNLIEFASGLVQAQPYAAVCLHLVIIAGALVMAWDDLHEEWRRAGWRFHAAAAGASLLGLIVAAVVIPTFTQHGWEGHESFYLDIFLGRDNEEMHTSALLTSPLLRMLYLTLAVLPGLGPWSMLVISLIFGAASIWVGAQLARIWTGSAAGGLAAALLIALHPNQAVWSSSAYQVILPFLIALCSVLVLVIAVARPTWPLYVAAAGLWTLAVATRIEYVFLGPALAAIVALGGRRTLRNWRAWLPGVAVAIVFVALQVLRLGGTVAERDAGEPMAYYLGHIKQNVLWIELWYPYNSPLCWPALALGVVALASRWRVLVAIIGVVVVFHLPYTIYYDYSTRHTLLSVVLLAVVAGAGVAYAWRDLPFGPLGKGLAAALALACAVPSLGTLLTFRERYYGEPELIQTVEDRTAWAQRVDLDAYLAQDCYLITEWVPLWERTACGSHVNLADPLDRPQILADHDGCVLWLYDVDNVLWTSRDVHMRAARLKWLYDWELLGSVTLDDGYEALVYQLIVE